MKRGVLCPSTKITVNFAWTTWI